MREAVCVRLEAPQVSPASHTRRMTVKWCFIYHTALMLLTWKDEPMFVSPVEEALVRPDRRRAEVLPRLQR